MVIGAHELERLPLGTKFYLVKRKLKNWPNAPFHVDETGSAWHQLQPEFTHIVEQCKLIECVRYSNNDKFHSCIAKIEDSFYTINDYLDRENVCFMTTNFKEAVVVAFEMDTFNESKKQYAVLV